ncbi:family 1 glycosylhydrolase [Micromonospora sp. LOL_015]|uniref:family 1 glycosylhydrolase n=1 Tax=Micromonospora sp. LOL_015 TaxID=3345416 RepID=UPI003A8A9701
MSIHETLPGRLPFRCRHLRSPDRGRQHQRHLVPGARHADGPRRTIRPGSISWRGDRPDVTRRRGAVRVPGQRGAGLRDRARRRCGRRRPAGGLHRTVAGRSARRDRDDGVPVLGYCHWTLLDNLEWAAGYRFHFGLHTVDRETFARTPKPSTARYAAVATSRALP